VQTELDRERFVTLGVERARVRVVGSTKYDQLSSTDLLPQRELLARDFGLDATRPVFVAGSVRSGEIEIVVNAYLRAREKVPSLQLILAPRHPERFESAAFALSQIGLPFAKRSDGRPRELSAVLLLDTFGELRAAYALGSVAFVGGTLVDIGGHNLLEPAVFRVPVTFGRYTQNMKEIAAGLKASGGAIEVQNGEELAEIIAALAIDVERRARVGERAHQVWQRNVGATDIVCDEIATLIGMPGAAEGVAREAQVRP
jgi:3-deoxy-D-manno-octulosonic-acid transferase